MKTLLLCIRKDESGHFFKVAEVLGRLLLSGGASGDVQNQFCQIHDKTQFLIELLGLVVLHLDILDQCFEESVVKVNAVVTLSHFSKNQHFFKLGGGL